jgi:sec-independent protein translocase protein TatC
MDEKKLGFLEHLEELRKRILYSIICVGVLAIIGYIFSERVMNVIIQRSGLESAYFFSPIEAFMVRIKVAIFLGILVSFPFLLYQIWAFIGPGLTRKERTISVSFMTSGIILFIVGLSFGYFILIPYGLQFLLSFGSESVQPLMNISRYLTFIFWCFLGCGFLFQLPLILFFLMRLGIVDIKTLTQHRAEAIVAILIVCAIITPTGDFFTLLLLSVPLLILFELSILAAKLSMRGKTKKNLSKD